MSKLILGTVQFGLNYGVNNIAGKPEKSKVFEILKFALSNGIKLLDTAESYGNAPKIIGLFHRIHRNKFEVISKYNPKDRSLPDNLLYRVKQNLKEMHIDYLYAYLFHCYDDFNKNFKNFSILKKLKKDGLIKKIGVSIYTNNELKEVLKYDFVDLIQLPFNLLDNHYQRSSLLKIAQDKGLEIHTRSVFLQGLFFMNNNTLPEKLCAFKPYIVEVDNLAKKENQSKAGLSLNYVLQKEYIDKVLLGVDSLSQLKENLKSVNSPISKKTEDKIDRFVFESPELLNPSNWK